LHRELSVKLHVNIHTTPPPFADLFPSTNTIVLGDFNASNCLWGSHTNDARGILLETAINTNNCVVLNNGQGTHETNNGKMTCIDVSVVSRILATKCTWSVFNNLMGSDDAPIKITFNARSEHQFATIPKWKLTMADWISFQHSIENQVDNIITSKDHDVENLDNQIINIIISAAEQSIPQTKPCVLERHKPLPYWNDDIKTAFRNRNRARNKMNRTKNINDIIEYKRLKAIAQRVIRQTARQHWQSFCDTLHSHTRLGTVWNMARKMNGTKSNPTSIPLIQDGNVVQLNKDKAEVFARSFASVSSTTNYSPDFQRHKTNIEQNHTYLFTNNSPDTEITSCLNKDFTKQELSLAINQFKKNSSPGAKCKVMHYGKCNIGLSYTMNGQPVEEVRNERDLGIIEGIGPMQGSLLQSQPHAGANKQNNQV